MTAEFETAGVCTETWWSSSNGTLSSCFLPRSTEIALDISGFEWQDIDIIDAQTNNENHLNTSTFLGNTNLGSTSQTNVLNTSNPHEEEIFNPINSFLEGLFDSSEQLYVPDNAKLEQLESFHFFDDVFLNNTRTVSVFDHENRDKPEEEIQACKRTSEKTQKVEDIQSSPLLKRPRLETPSHFPSFKVRKEKLGDRITALQQLVSPFGKTDTASVLNDAIEYIKYLQEQVTVSSNPHQNSRGYGDQKQYSDKTDRNTHYEDCSPGQDLRSRGLCLMPISSTFSTSPQPLDASIFWN